MRAETHHRPPHTEYGPAQQTYLSARSAPRPHTRPLSGAGGFNLSVLTVGAK